MRSQLEQFLQFAGLQRGLGGNFIPGQQGMNYPPPMGPPTDPWGPFGSQTARLYIQKAQQEAIRIQAEVAAQALKRHDSIDLEACPVCGVFGCEKDCRALEE